MYRARVENPFQMYTTQLFQKVNQWMNSNSSDETTMVRVADCVNAESVPGT